MNNGKDASYHGEWVFMTTIEESRRTNKESLKRKRRMWQNLEFCIFKTKQVDDWPHQPGIKIDQANTKSTRTNIHAP